MGFYKVTLKRGWSIDEVVPTCRKPQRLPVVLSRDEVSRFLAAVALRKHRVILTVCYAAGLRISEAVRLTAAAIDVITHPCFGRSDQAVTVCRMVLKTLVPGLRRAVSTTLRMSASPSAAHMAR